MSHLSTQTLHYQHHGDMLQDGMVTMDIGGCVAYLEKSRWGEGNGSETICTVGLTSGFNLEIFLKGRGQHSTLKVLGWATYYLLHL